MLNAKQELIINEMIHEIIQQNILKISGKKGAISFHNFIIEEIPNLILNKLEQTLSLKKQFENSPEFSHKIALSLDLVIQRKLKIKK